MSLESDYEKLAILVGMQGFDESEIMEEVEKRLNTQAHLEAECQNAKNLLKSINRLLEKEKNNDLFVETVRQLFVNQ